MMFEIWINPRRSIVSSPDLTEQLREKFFGSWRSSNFARPTCPDLRAKGETRPTWLSIIFFFFSREFTNRAFKQGLWPLTLYLQEETAIRWLGFTLSVYVLHSLIF